MGEAFVSPLRRPRPRGRDRPATWPSGPPWAAPVLIVAFGLIWGIDGALSTAYAIAIVVRELRSLGRHPARWSARISLGMLMGAALFGFLIRLAIVFVAVLAVEDASWVEVVPLGITIVVTHLGLLFWEMQLRLRHRSRFPGLKPTPRRPARRHHRCTVPSPSLHG